MGLRVCLVTPFAWSRPHDVNEHVAGIARELRALGHQVTVLAPSTRAADLIEGRRALLDGGGHDVIALGPAVPVSRRSRIGVPVGVRANLSLALARGGYDIVHGFEPGLPSLSYLALRDAHAFTIATFLSPERLGYPPGRAQRERLLARIDALVATSAETAAAAAERLPGDYRVLTPGVDTELFRPVRKRRAVLFPWGPTGRARTRAPRRRAHVRTLRDGAARAPLLNEASIFVPAFDGLARVSLEAAAAGAAIVSPPGGREQPELAAAAIARLAEDDDYRERSGARARADAEKQSFAALARNLDSLYRGLARDALRPRITRPLDDREWLLADLHLHTSWSHDCGIPVVDLLDHAEAEGLGAIAVTDHNVFGGALEAAGLARARDLVVIPGEEVKTADQGEVIGLFLTHEIPSGLSFGETVAAIRAQGGVVYLPHPFDRMHAIPDAATLHRYRAELDVVEVYNARLLFEAYNDEALRFARKYDLMMGAGSDAHVLQGVGTGALRMRAFEGPAQFLAGLRLAQVLRRP